MWVIRRLENEGCGDEITKRLNATQGIDARYVHFSNAGENGAFDKLCKLEWMGVKFEYTTSSIPHQTSREKWKFAMLYSRISAMLNYGKNSYFLKNSLRSKAANTATLLERIKLENPKIIINIKQNYTVEHRKSLGEFSR